MQKFAFERGDSIKIMLEGVPLGGVLSIAVADKKEVYEISEYLSGTPTVTSVSRQYVITLEMCGEQGRLFSESDRHESIEIVGAKCHSIYRGCAVSGFETLTEGSKPTKYIITLIAETREENDSN